MKDFKGFVFYNNISQKDITEYLGVSKGYMSLVISGKKKLSEENFRKLLENPYGWDTSMLTGLDKPKEAAESQPSQEAGIIELLKEQNADLQAKVDALNQQIGELKALLKKESETAGTAGVSLSVNAV